MAATWGPNGPLFFVYTPGEENGDGFARCLPGRLVDTVQQGLMMRTIRNLVWFLLAFAFTVWAGIANAQTVYPYPAVPHYRVQTAIVNVDGAYHPERMAACQAFVPLYNAYTTNANKPFEINFCSQAIIQLKSTRNSTTLNVGNWAPTQYRCTKGGRLSGTSCVKDAAFPDVPDDPPPPPPGCPDDIAGEASCCLLYTSPSPRD